MNPPAGAALLCLLLAVQAGGPAPEPTPSEEVNAAGSLGPAVEPALAPRPRRVSPTVPLEALWKDYVRAEEAGDTEAAVRGFAEIRRVRVERNIDTHETIGLALVGEGVPLLDGGALDEAERAFGRAVDLAPGLPDGYYGRATVQLKRGPFGVVPSIRAIVSGWLAFGSTARGSLRTAAFLASAALLAGFLVIGVLAFTLLLRHGGLLRHDIEEWLGPAQSRSASLALWLLLLLFPLAAFQGWGWLPLWWLAILFPYFNRLEKAVSVAAVVATILVGPALERIEQWEVTARNPLYEAAMAAVEGEPDARQARLLQEAARAHPDDKDLAYLLASAWRRAGRTEEAAALYRRLLRADPNDAVARNNLGNLEFLRGDYEAARGRYREGVEAGGPDAMVATSFYNLSIAHLEKFEYQAFNEAKSNADRLAAGVVAGYDRWKYDSGDYAVVDLGLSRDDVWRRFAGRSEGIGETRAGFATLGVSPGSFLNRFAAAAAIFALVALLVGWIRGGKAFTVHCTRCGTAFCRHCHLGKVVGDLCSQCHHLFVVRDGVSGPARNRKMTEVQVKEGRRSRLFRLLSVLSPGAGQVYARQTLTGTALLSVWYVVIAGLVTSRLLPLTETSSRLTPPWGLVAAAFTLVAVWVVANRLPPNFDVALPRRHKSGRSRAGQGG